LFVEHDDLVVKNFVNQPSLSWAYLPDNRVSGGWVIRCTKQDGAYFNSHCWSLFPVICQQPAFRIRVICEFCGRNYPPSDYTDPADLFLSGHSLKTDNQKDVVWRF